MRSGIAEGFDADGSSVGCPGFTYTTNGLPGSAPICAFKDFMERVIPSYVHLEGSIELSGVYSEADKPAAV